MTDLSLTGDEEDAVLGPPTDTGQTISAEEDDTQQAHVEVTNTQLGGFFGAVKKLFGG